MITVTLERQDDFARWKDAARKLLLHNILPENANWSAPDGGRTLFALTGQSLAELPNIAPDKPLTVSSKFIGISQRVICHRDPERFARLYRILWRLRDDRSLLSQTTDHDIIWMTECDKAIRRDRHKMHAFVRFKKVGEDRYKREQFAAWFEPAHYITRLATPFFMRRFPNMDWIIVTPDCTAVWNGTNLSFAPGGSKSDVPSDDAMEDHWKVYFRSIFNPARLKVGAMMSEMPKKYWHNMPEAAEIPALIAGARGREQAMRDVTPSAPHPLATTLKRRAAALDNIRRPENLNEASSAIQSCTRCPLYRDASQAVFGEGPPKANLMIVGEQPGDEEDIAGRPFIGPAGEVLNEALNAAEIDRSSIYLTNAVKHFKFKPRGKWRIHERPSAGEIDYCRWWLKTEINLVKPKVIIALGTSAARAITGKSLNISDCRGDVVDLKNGRKLVISYHPAFILRAPSQSDRDMARASLISDLSLARMLSATLPAMHT